jgi:hypothetical protein
MPVCKCEKLMPLLFSDELVAGVKGMMNLRQSIFRGQKGLLYVLGVLTYSRIDFVMVLNAFLVPRTHFAQTGS